MESETYTPERRKPGRPSNAEIAQRESRTESVKRERRRRADTSETAGLKLAVPDSVKKPGYTYRWVNETQGGRVKQLYDQDWDVVKNLDVPSDGEGSPIARNVEKEKPLRAVLMEKPLELHQEDQAVKRARLKETEDAMMRGPVKSPDGLQQAEAYVPAGYANKIVRGS